MLALTRISRSSWQIIRDAIHGLDTNESRTICHLLMRPFMKESPQNLCMTPRRQFRRMSAAFLYPRGLHSSAIIYRVSAASPPLPQTCAMHWEPNTVVADYLQYLLMIRSQAINTRNMCAWNLSKKI